MSYTVSTSHCWYNDQRIIVRMYFLEGVPFTFDELPDGPLYDRELLEEANKHQSLEIDDVYAGSNYLIFEQAHPCFDDISIKNPKTLPEELSPYFTKEDLLG